MCFKTNVVNVFENYVLLVLIKSEFYEAVRSISAGWKRQLTLIDVIPLP